MNVRYYFPIERSRITSKFFLEYYITPIHCERSKKKNEKSISTILLFYIVPLLLYIAGIKAMRFIMAVLCGMGLCINLVILASVFIIMRVNDYSLSSVLGVIIFARRYHSQI
ncbi:MULTISPECIES: DUF5391 family protein [Bacillus]|uniref:DUF5391 family protein n=1 Tax=Bacillus TaxID=1386 RepID=UPI001E609B52|nr:MULTISPECIES: DUF5391 family protein [Bacillus cereus group]MDF2084623.1 DUF5391 family protein [Bacillus pseudomycoides]